jgi:hypothetical protein
MNQMTKEQIETVQAMLNEQQLVHIRVLKEYFDFITKDSHKNSPIRGVFSRALELLFETRVVIKGIGIVED